jgi:hypothetical protein
MSHPELDPVYFSDDPWGVRVQSWLAGKDESFLEGNRQLIRQIMENEESGLRMVVNISAQALLGFLAARKYYNLYENPVIGGVRREPSKEREKVDRLLEFGEEARNFYFGAAALGGTGVRFYGEYCMAMKPSRIDKQTTRLFDRDSYDLLLSPLKDEPDVDVLAKQLKGNWGSDLMDMLTLKLLPELRGANRLITTGTVSEMILHDQEFVEVHRQQSIFPSDIEEVRHSPDEIAMEARIQSLGNAGIPPTAVERLWLRQRLEVVKALEREGIRYRVVTLHGRGYQWR